MPFKSILQELVESTSGASGAILTDWEGEAVVFFGNADEYELKLIGAYKNILLNRIKEVQQGVSHGEIHEAVITTEFLHIITGVVGSDYSLVMTLRRDAVLGRALFAFQKSVKLLEKEIY